MDRTHHLIARGKRHNMNRGGKKRRSLPKHRRIVYSGVDSPTLNSDPGYDTVAGVVTPRIRRADDRSGLLISTLWHDDIAHPSIVSLRHADERSGNITNKARPLMSPLRQADERSGNTKKSRPLFTSLRHADEPSRNTLTSPVTITPLSLADNRSGHTRARPSISTHERSGNTLQGRSGDNLFLSHADDCFDFLSLSRCGVRINSHPSYADEHSGKSVDRPIVLDDGGLLPSSGHPFITRADDRSGFFILLLVTTILLFPAMFVLLMSAPLSMPTIIPFILRKGLRHFTSQIRTSVEPTQRLLVPINLALFFPLWTWTLRTTTESLLPPVLSPTPPLLIVAFRLMAFTSESTTLIQRPLLSNQVQRMLDGL